MGVRGLQTFISKQVPGGINDVDINNEIHSWKRDNAECLIVIDMYGFTSIANKDKIVQYCGGRYKQLQDQFETFFKRLVEAGAKLAFFVDGPHQAEKDETWNLRQDTNYANELRLFDAIDSGQHLADIVPNMNDLSTGSVAIVRPLEDICKRYGCFHTSIANECDLELAQYACQNKAMAILGQDSDFLIFDGHWQYWSSDNLDMEKMTTVRFNRSALRRELGLAQSQMCMLATLCGNDLISFASLANFHQHFRPYYRKFNKIADYVRYIPALPNNLSDQHLKDIAWDCFGEASYDNVKLLRCSIKSYDVGRTLSACDKTKIGYGENSIYTLKMGIPYAMTMHYFDMRRAEFINMWTIFEPMIQRQAGFVLQDEAIDKQKCFAIVKRSHETPYEQVTVQPKFPDDKVELEKLHQPNDTAMDGDRFQWLSWILTGDSNGIPGITCIPMGYMVISVVLYFLVKKKLITIGEADTILLTVHAAKTGKIADHIVYPTHLNSHDMMIGHLYLYMHSFFIKSFYLVGLRKVVDELVYDGIYFNSLSQKMRADNCQPNEAALQQIGQLRQIYANLV